jgi:hypothetical protein
MFEPRRKHIRPSTACYGGSFTFVYVDDVRTLQETHLRPSTACHGDSFNFEYVDDVRTSQETHLRPSAACYGGSFTFIYVYYVRTSQETHLRLSAACYGRGGVALPLIAVCLDQIVFSHLLLWVYLLWGSCKVVRSAEIPSRKQCNSCNRHS